MTGGVEGGLHTRDFKITDPEKAYILPAKAIAMTVVDLLFNEAETAKSVIENFKPLMSKKKYLDFMKSVSLEKSFESSKD